LRRSHFLVWVRRQLGQLDADAIGASDGYAFEYRPDFRAAWLDESWVQVEEQLAEIGARLEMPRLDLYPVLNGDADLLADGIHLTAVGRRRVAAHLAMWLGDAGLLSTDN
jgi:lysophospholipase L1-like esterase